MPKRRRAAGLITKANCRYDGVDGIKELGQCLRSRKVMIAAYIDEFIMFCAGLWMTSVGFGYLTLSRNPANRVPMARHFKWMGPLLLTIAIVLAIAS